ncbi:amidophosphoribosyltransferase [Butyricicoccus sp.]|uniref:amidophosphoribosyltransferase n=1 Tax=Butyricicoccus sp. TaxID=2049021 RepID=UPI003736E989
MRKADCTPFGMQDKLHEECGVFGVYVNEKDVDKISPAHDTHTALFALQHRGQEACGIAVNRNGVIKCHKDLGLVNDVFNQEILDGMPGTMAIGHVRYSTTGLQSRENAQPVCITHCKGNLAIAHNGNLVNAGELRKAIELDGGIFRSSSDTEVLAYTIVRERLRCGSIEDAVLNAMYRVQGAYSLLVMSPRKLIAARDPHGFRPLVLGKLHDSYIFASETCALDALGAEFVRDVEPGEVIIIEDGQMRTMKCDIHCNHTTCVFEYIYFARPDSVIDGASVAYARQEAGRYLYEEDPIEADVVIGVPDSGLTAAIGYSKASGIPYDVGLIKNRYIARTFIQPGQDNRERSVRIKLNALRNNLEGKRVVMVDDSIVRGTTCARLVKILRDAGAKEVHMRVSAPPFLHPCFFGTDVPDRKYLIAYGRTVEEIRDLIGVDSLGYLSLEATNKIAVGAKCGFCNGCFSGEYPIEVPDTIEKNIFESGIGENA